MKIFLSYATEDREVAASICFSLRAEGHEVFFDEVSLPAGGNYNTRIRAAISQCELFAFLISPHSITPGRYTLTELNLACRRWPNPSQHVLPVVVAPTPDRDIPAYLNAVTRLTPLGNLAAEVALWVADLRHDPGDMRKTQASVARAEPAVSYASIHLSFATQPDGRFVLGVPSSPAGSVSAAPCEIEPGDLQKLLWMAPQPVSGPLRRGGTGMGTMPGLLPSAADARVVGEHIYALLQEPHVRDCVDRSRRQVNPQRGLGLRFLVDTSNAPELALLPWELAYDPVREDFIFCDRMTPLVRWQDIGTPAPTLAVRLPVRLLVVVAAPKDRPESSIGEEISRLHDVMDELTRQGLVETVYLEHATLEAMDAALLKHAPHILHFIGHGDFVDGQAAVILETSAPGATSDPINGRRLALVLRNHLASLRFVFLNNCLGAAARQGDPLGSVAYSLVRRGVPAVVAMQFPVTDRAAVLLAHHFYRYLSTGLPVDTALTSARAFLLARGCEVEWAAPALHTCALDGNLFDVDSGAVHVEFVPTAAYEANRASNVPMSRSSTAQSADGEVPAVEGTTEHAFLTIVFADISGSTRLYEVLGDGPARAQVASCLQVLTDVTKRHGGSVIKTIGDELMCTFPTAESAVSAACEMHEMLEDEVVESPSAGQISLAIRIGLHHGPAILEAGDVFGDAVNVAARMASMAKAGQIITTQSTIDELPPILKASSRFIDRAPVKGKKETMDIFEVLWQQEDVTRMSTGVIPEPINRAQLDLRYHDDRVTVDAERSQVVLGRSKTADIAVAEALASRQHVRVEHRRGKFFIIDQSTNGTYVFCDGSEAFLRREEMPLTGSGKISLGRSFAENPQEIVYFKTGDGAYWDAASARRLPAAGQPGHVAPEHQVQSKRWSADPPSALEHSRIAPAPTPSDRAAADVGEADDHGIDVKLPGSADAPPSFSQMVPYAEEFDAEASAFLDFDDSGDDEDDLGDRYYASRASTDDTVNAQQHVDFIVGEYGNFDDEALAGRQTRPGDVESAVGGDFEEAFDIGMIGSPMHVGDSPEGDRGKPVLATGAIGPAQDRLPVVVAVVVAVAVGIGLTTFATSFRFDSGASHQPSVSTSAAEDDHSPPPFRPSPSPEAGGSEHGDTAQNAESPPPATPILAPSSPAVAEPGLVARISTALNAGRLSEARVLLEKAKATEAEHPDIVRLKAAFNARLGEAKALFDAYKSQYTDGDYAAALTTMEQARVVWADSDTFTREHARVRGRIDEQAATREPSSAPRVVTAALPPSNPCDSRLAGFGKRRQGTCFYFVSGDQRGPSMVVVPEGGEITRPFAIGKYEITVSDYNRYCMLSGGCEPRRDADGRQPITGISIADARAYVAWLSESTGKHFRLPTVGEWVYAAEAAGDQPQRDYNCRLEQGGKLLKGQGAMGVTTGKPNGWGLYNYIGNVQEWATSGERLVARGGAYGDPMNDCSIDFERAHDGTPDPFTGMRVVMDLGEPGEMPAPPALEPPIPVPGAPPTASLSPEAARPAIGSPAQGQPGTQGSHAESHGSSAPALAPAGPAVPRSIPLYSVVPGDTLWSIAASAYGNPLRWTEIYASNGAALDNPDRIFPGQRLRLEGSNVPLSASLRTYAVKPGNSLWGIARSELGTPSRWHEIYRANRDRIAHPDLIYPGQNLSLPMR